MIIFSSGYEPKNFPIVCGQNKATTTNLTVTSENASYPAVNMVNPNENQRWESNTASDQYVTVSLSEEQEIDYVAFAGHNFGDDDALISVETYDGSSWTERLAPIQITDNKPVIMKIEPISCSGVRLKIGSSDTTPTITVFYCGLCVEMERANYVGHTPINYGKVSNIVDGMSESGRFIGRIVIGENYTTNVEIDNLTPSFFRNKVNPFFVDAEKNPFFYAWRPLQYPNEVGFAWLRENGSMQNQLANGFVNISFPIGAIVDGRTITTEQPTERFITISEDVDDLNLRTLYDSLFPTPLDTTVLNVTVEAGVTIGSTSTANPALDIGTWPSGTTIDIDLAGTIQGAGGAGGDAPDGEGNDGGDAITAARAVTIDLASGGSIIDGAGGGAADTTNGGGGGAGSTGGLGGAADGGTAGNAGTASTGGTASGNAGAGGNAGLEGTDSDAADGGDSGCTIDDNPLITVVNSGSGTIEGCNVNTPSFGSVTIDITTDQVDYNLRTAYDGASHPTPDASTVVNCYIRNGVTISASDSFTPAFDVGSWPTGATINLHVNGTVVGAGGAGGDAADGYGEEGGTALYTDFPITIDFADQGSGADGEFSGGGGGGQAGTTDGGGGGAGDIVGAGGAADGGTAGNAGTATTGGTGGSASAGDGGNLGVDGEDNSGTQSADGAGFAGHAIEGDSNVTKVNAGDGTINGTEIDNYTFVTDDFTDETGIDTGSSTNQRYDAANDWYTQTTGAGTDEMPTMTSGTTSGVTVSADDSLSGYPQYEPYKAADDVVSGGTTDNIWHSAVGGTGWMKTDFGSSTDITGYTITAGNGVHVPYAPTAFTFEGSNNDSDWTVLDTQSSLSWTASEEKSFTLGSTESYRYYRINITAAGSYIVINEFELLGVGPEDDMTLLSNAISTGTAPTDVYAECEIKPVDAITINSDVVMEVSRDDGTTWRQCVLVEGATDGNGFKTYTDKRVNVSNQPSGTNLRYRIRTISAGEIQVKSSNIGYRT